MKLAKSIAACLGVLAFTACTTTPPAGIPPDSNAIVEVRDLVVEFGSRLQLVSLLAPDAADQIRSQYADFVASELLEAWAGDPLSAPGRLTSSPWPDRIEIAQITLIEDRYIVEGNLIEATSTGDSGSYPVLITVEDFGGSWLITDYQAGDRP